VAQAHGRDGRRGHGGVPLRRHERAALRRVLPIGKTSSTIDH